MYRITRTATTTVSAVPEPLAFMNFPFHFLSIPIRLELSHFLPSSVRLFPRKENFDSAFGVAAFPVELTQSAEIGEVTSRGCLPRRRPSRKLLQHKLPSRPLLYPLATCHSTPKWFWFWLCHFAPHRRRAQKTDCCRGATHPRPSAERNPQSGSGGCLLFPALTPAQNFYPELFVSEKGQREKACLPLQVMLLALHGSPPSRILVQNTREIVFAKIFY